MRWRKKDRTIFLSPSRPNVAKTCLFFFLVDTGGAEDTTEHEQNISLKKMKINVAHPHPDVAQQHNAERDWDKSPKEQKG